MGKLDHRVPFPKAGKGFFLFFSMQSIAEIEEVYGEDYYGDVERLCNMGSAKCVMTCLNAGLRNADGSLASLDYESKLPFTFNDVGPLIIEALTLAVAGKSYKELLADLTKEQERLKKEAAAKLKNAKEEADKGEDPFEVSEE